MISKRRLRQIIQESLGDRRGGFLGEWYEDNGGYYKDADCFYILDQCMRDGGIVPEDAMAVCDELAEHGINSLEDLKQNWINQTNAKMAWMRLYVSMAALQDLFHEVDDWRDDKYGARGLGGNRFPPAVGPMSPYVGGPAFVTCAWCLAVC